MTTKSPVPMKARKNEILTRRIATDSEKNAVILVDKPAGLTSAATLNRVKRILGLRKMGHSGTLDKFASGLLVVCTGNATKLTRYFLDSDKRYTGQVKLGEITDSCDTEGVLTESRDWSGITREDVSRALGSFRGRISQRPPEYSALKIGGVRASDRVRAGEEVDLGRREVTIHELTMTDFDSREGVVTLDILCSKGTYIRSLARDLGETLGCGAHLRHLRRTASGTFNVMNAMTLPELEEFAAGGEYPGHAVLSPGDALGDFGTVVVTPEGARRALNGADFTREEVISLCQGPKNLFVILDEYKNLIAIADITIGQWQIRYQNVFHNQSGCTLAPKESVER